MFFWCPGWAGAGSPGGFDIAARSFCQEELCQSTGLPPGKCAIRVLPESTSCPVSELSQGDIVLRSLIGPLTEDDVIEDFDFKQLTDADEIARDTDIGV